MLDQQLVEIERLVDIVLGRRRNPQAADQAIIGMRSAERLSRSKKAATSPGFCAAASLLANSAIGTGSRTTFVGGPGFGPDPGLAPPCFPTARIGNPS
jgi:hypothetical protein